MKKDIKQEIFGKDGYQEMGEISYKVISYINKVKEDNQIYELPENLVITYSPKRVQKDRADRERLIKKARSLLEIKARIKASNKRGGKKYLKENRSIDWALDEQAILNERCLMDITVSR